MVEAKREHGGPGGGSWWGRLRALPNESPLKTVVVTLVVAFVGSLLVAGSAVLLRPLQVANKEAERRSHIAELVRRLPDAEVRLAAADGLKVEARVVDLESGRYVPAIEASRYDQRRAAGDPEQSVAIPPKADFAGLKRRAPLAVAYLVTEHGRLELIILPVRGQGYGSMLYGYLGLAADGDTVVGLSFYEHGETPGLGALVDAPEWKAQWQGKRTRDQKQVLRIGVGSGRVAPESPQAPYQVDGLSGATWTSRGITNLLHYWLGEHGFAPYLRRIREPRS